MAKLRKNQKAWREEKLRNFGCGFYQRSRNEKEKSLRKTSESSEGEISIKG